MAAKYKDNDDETFVYSHWIGLANTQEIKERHKLYGLIIGTKLPIEYCEETFTPLNPLIHGYILVITNRITYELIDKTGQ